MESLKRLFGFSVEEDPLEREIEEMRKAAKAAIKEVEKREKQAKRTSGGESGKRDEGGGARRGFGGAFSNAFRGLSRSRRDNSETGGLSRAVEEMESIFSEIE